MSRQNPSPLRCAGCGGELPRNEDFWIEWHADTDGRQLTEFRCVHLRRECQAPPSGTLCHMHAVAYHETPAYLEHTLARMDTLDGEAAYLKSVIASHWDAPHSREPQPMTDAERAERVALVAQYVIDVTHGDDEDGAGQAAYDAAKELQWGHTYEAAMAVMDGDE
jgi:hypothetical protein